MDALARRTRTALLAAEKAGAFLARSASRLKPSDIRLKSKNNFVTWVDHESETLVRRIIRREHPSDAVLGEEMGQKGSGPVRWVVDPLDGTSNFIHNIPFYGVSIAVEVEERTEIGVLCIPARGELFVGRRGRGAFLNHKRVHVSTRKSLGESLVGTAVPYKSLAARWNSYESLLRTITRSGADTRRSGALAVDLAYVACGKLDALWAFDQAAWDIAAGALLVREAGGVLSNLWDVSRDAREGDLLAGNPDLHARLSRICKGLKKKF